MPRAQPGVALGDVLDSRHSVRVMGPPSIALVSALLWHVARVRQTGVGNLGLRWEQVATALTLAFCLLGLVGAKAVAALDSGPMLVPVGTAVIGVPE